MYEFLKVKRFREKHISHSQQIDQMYCRTVIIKYLYEKGCLGKEIYEDIIWNVASK